MQTVESVRAQTYPWLEHIIVDGGSTDGTLDLLRALGSDPRIQWTSAPDDGMYDAINSGLHRSRGAIVTYLNSDDLLLPWAIERVVDELERHPEVDLIYGDALRYFQELDQFDLILQPTFRRNTLGRTGSLVQPAVFWRRSVLDRIGPFDTEYRLSADLDFWLRASGQSVFRQVDEVLAIERAHPAAQTTRFRSRLGMEARAIRAKMHPDGLLRLPLKLLARFVDGVDARRRMFALVRAIMTSGTGWSRFREVCRPNINRWWLAAALVTPRPLAGTSSSALAMKILRRRWIRIDTDRLWSAVISPGPNP